MINKISFKALGLLAVLIFLVVSGLGCKLQTAEESAAISPITLTYWRVWDDQDAFDQVIADYRAIHPNITINYRKFKYEEFEQELLNALAEDRGPDIFSVPQAWLKEYQTKIAPMPEQIRIGYVVEKTYFAIKKERVVEVRTEKTPTLRQIKDKYVDTVFNDVVLENQVYGLPLSLETLVMFYNKDIMNQAGIATLPADWKSFQEAVIKTTKFETEDKIIQSGTALGTGFNIERAFDIISILMIQNGAQMADAKGQPTFFKSMTISGKPTNPGLIAMRFYADFATPVKTVYSWNNAMSNSLEAFLAGKVGFFFGYNYHLAQIRSRSRVNFGIAPIPQIAGNPVKNYANYWVETVSKKSKHPNEAWDFLIFITKQEENAKFLSVTNHSAAQRTLLDSQAENEDLSASVSQALTATTWYRGYDALTAETIFKEMAEQFLLAVTDQQVNNIISSVTQKISQTIIQPN